MDTLPALETFFLNPVALSVLVGIVVAWIKKHIYNTQDSLTIIMSLAIGLILGVTGHLLGYVATPFYLSMLNGIFSGFLAAGGYDLLSSVLSKGMKKEFRY